MNRHFFITMIKYSANKDFSDRSLSEIKEFSYYGAIPSDDDSYLVRTTYQLYFKKLKDFTVEDIRIMLSQNNALELLIPMAISVLKENILAEGDFFEGDLLITLLRTDQIFWINHVSLKEEVKLLIFENQESIRTIHDLKLINNFIDSFSI